MYSCLCIWVVGGAWCVYASMHVYCLCVRRHIRCIYVICMCVVRMYVQILCVVFVVRIGMRASDVFKCVFSHRSREK